MIFSSEYQEIIKDMMLSECVLKSKPTSEYESIYLNYEIVDGNSILSKYNLLRLYFFKFYVSKFNSLAIQIKIELLKQNNTERYLDVLLLELAINESIKSSDKKFLLNEVLSFISENGFLSSSKREKCYYHLAISYYQNEEYLKALDVVKKFLLISKKKYEIMAILGTHISSLLEIEIDKSFLNISLCQEKFKVLLNYFLLDNLSEKEIMLERILKEFNEYQLISMIFNKEKKKLKAQKNGKSLKKIEIKP